MCLNELEQEVTVGTLGLLLDILFKVTGLIYIMTNKSLFKSKTTNVTNVY